MIIRGGNPSGNTMDAKRASEPGLGRLFRSRYLIGQYSL